jgi:hypothetical protein
VRVPRRQDDFGMLGLHDGVFSAFHFHVPVGVLARFSFANRHTRQTAHAARTRTPHHPRTCIALASARSAVCAAASTDARAQRSASECRRDIHTISRTQKLPTLRHATTIKTAPPTLNFCLFALTLQSRSRSVCGGHGIGAVLGVIL